MSKEICISSTPHETRLAILEDDQLTEIYYERENEYTLAGSIYKGRVTRVLPGMQSAFVDLGLERDAFLYVTDFWRSRKTRQSLSASADGHAGKVTKREPRVESRRRIRAARPGIGARHWTAAAEEEPRRNGGPANPLSGEASPAVRRRQANLRMAPAVGGAVVAAARAFAHRRVGPACWAGTGSSRSRRGSSPVQPAATIERASRRATRRCVISAWGIAFEVWR